MKTSDNTLIKTAADTLDLIILRAQVDDAMTPITYDSARLQKLARARDMLVELYIDAGLIALHEPD